MPPPPIPRIPPTTAIIGAGFSGTLTALNILSFEGLPEPAHIVLFERTGRFGPGLAYSTRALVHYLNVPAGNMSAWESDPQHFIRWLQVRNPAAEGGSFVSRGWYGDYLKEQLDAARVRHHDRLELRPTGIVRIDRRPDGEGGGDRFDLTDTAGRTTTADRVILALGNFPAPTPSGMDPALLAHPGYIADPWAPDAITSILPDEPVLMIGTGLTMMDVVMQLHAREHAGRMVAISRHGLTPRPHRSPARPPSKSPPPATLEAWDGTTRALLRIIRDAVRDQAARGIDWRDVIASLRPVTSPLWHRLDAAERGRFLTRLRSYWEVVRHRAAPESAAAVADLIAARHLSVRAGRILRISPSQREGAGGRVREAGSSQDSRLLDVTFRPRRSENPQTLRFSRIINCLGPECDPRAIDDPLMRSLLASGLITPDPLGLGIATSPTGAAINSDGHPDEALLIVGPFRKAQHWENTAVPELRRQAAEVARQCLAPISTITVGASTRGAAAQW